MCIYTHLFKRCIYPCPSLVRENPVVKRQYEDFWRFVSWQSRADQDALHANTSQSHNKSRPGQKSAFIKWEEIAKK